MKRLLDLAVSGIALLVLSIPLVLIALIVRICMGSPVLFKQMRPGYRGRPFKMLKFRTMIDPKPGELSSDEKRLTPFGKLLRSTSLDELPELLNIFKGDMSLVGPRPLLMTYLDRYSPRQARRHEVKPGLTGWAQVNGRNAISWEDRLEMDVWYVENQSFLLDLKIIWMTFGAVFRRKGISAAGTETMHEFMGSSSHQGVGKNGV